MRVSLFIHHQVANGWMTSSPLLTVKNDVWCGRGFQHVESVLDINMGMCNIRQKKMLIINLSSIFDHEWRDLQKDNNKAVVTKLEGLRVTLESVCRPWSLPILCFRIWQFCAHYNNVYNFVHFGLVGQKYEKRRRSPGTEVIIFMSWQY